MGCASSKQVEVVAASDAHRPPPSSLAVFDITSVKEPCLDLDPLLSKPSEAQQQQLQSGKPSLLPAPILDKLNTLETDNTALESLDETSKPLQLQDLNTQPKSDNTVPVVKTAAIEKKETNPLLKSASSHTQEELEAAKASKKPEEIKTAGKDGTTSTDSTRPQLMKLTHSTTTESPAPTTGAGPVIKPVRENIFILKDREERSKEGKVQIKWDPLSDFPEKCPPGGAHSVVVYTTSLRGVRKTYEDCTTVSMLFEEHGAVVDERDVSLDSGLLRELKELIGEGSGAVGVPRVFVRGRYIGGADEVVELSEAGKLGRILRWARVERVGEGGREACGGCGDARFVPCLDCGGSCKVVAADGGAKERCSECNENGLVRCPTCHS